MTNYRFSVIVEKDQDGYFASCPEFQGCYTQGETYMPSTPKPGFPRRGDPLWSPCGWAGTGACPYSTCPQPLRVDPYLGVPFI
jgi:hypothetical protein